MPRRLDRRMPQRGPASRSERARTALRQWLRLRTLHASPKWRSALPFACAWIAPMSAENRPASGSPPTCAPAAHVDVGERSVAVRGAIDADAARELRML